jgi:hypothetical protein
VAGHIATEERDLTTWTSSWALVTREGRRLGWVPDPLLHHLRSIDRPQLTVVRANPVDLGHHLRLLVKVTGHVDYSGNGTGVRC